MPTLLTEKVDGTVTHTPTGIEAAIARLDAHLSEICGVQLCSADKERDFLLDLRNDLSRCSP